VIESDNPQSKIARLEAKFTMTGFSAYFGGLPLELPKVRRVLALFAAALVLSAAPRNEPVSVLYAGSLAAVMENGIGPAFSKATAYSFQGEAQGSLGAARMIRDHIRSPDVFVSADPFVNDTVLIGSHNGNIVTWYFILASSELVLGYNPQGKYGALFEKARAHTIPWYQTLETPGVRFGRGDPSIDPKGYRTLFLFRLAADYYHHPELASLPGEDRNPSQVYPEIVLLGRLESGQLDAGIFYKHEAIAHKLPYVTFPPQISLCDPNFSAFYARESYTTPAGEHIQGAPILLTVTIPSTVHHLNSSLTFVQFLLTSNELLKSFGFGIVAHRVGGDSNQVPQPLRQFAQGMFRP
jgi:molybdate/tungstate transport system substrate-binding protein